MARTQRQRERAEKARQLMRQRVVRAQVLRVAYVPGTREGDEGLVPACIERLEGERIGWGRIDTTPDRRSALIWLIDRAQAPGRLLSSPDVERIAFDEGDFDRLHAPDRVQARGHFSYAHRHVLYGPETFGTNYDPLSLHADFAALSDDQSRAYSGAVRCRAGQASNDCVYRWDTAAQPPNDSSVAADVNAHTDRGYPGVIGRLTAADEFYHLRTNSANSTLQLYENTNAAGYVLLGSDGTHYAQAATIRLEMVGTALKGYIDGNEDISVVDGTHTTGWAAIRVRRTNTSYDPTLDNLTVYDEALTPIAALAADVQGDL